MLSKNNDTLAQKALFDLAQYSSLPTLKPTVTKAPVKPKEDNRDIVFPSSNVLGIPDLLLTHQCDRLLLPCLPYRKMALKKHEGCLHFYVDDYRFDPSIWNDPDKIQQSKISAIIEPNYTLSLDSPISWVVWSTYKKRWLSRYWQQLGYRIIVDVNVPAEFYPIVLMGVPQGWRSFSSRGYSERTDSLLNEYEMCRKHAQREDIFFLVYGGGKTVLSLCRERGWAWLADEESRSRGIVYG